jgi:glutaminyl-peptide cyclotransferase
MYKPITFSLLFLLRFISCKKKQSHLFLACILLIISCNNNPETDTGKLNNSTPTISFTVLDELPHDKTSFTEGLFVHNNKLFESTGSPENLPKTKSIFGIVDLETGKIDVKSMLDKTIYFGEGVTLLNGKVYQLTYQKQTCFVYDTVNFKKIKQYSFRNKEGWGLTNNGNSLIMSDGTNVLTFLNPNNFSEIKKLNVSENGFAVDSLNELEYVKGFIYANVWPTNKVVKIDCVTGKVVAKIDLSSLKSKANSLFPKSYETNGIAYESTSNEFYVTGKMWPKIFKLKLNQ